MKTELVHPYEMTNFDSTCYFGSACKIEQSLKKNKISNPVEDSFWQ